MTSKTSIGQARSDAASRAPAPTGPTQVASARRCDGAAGCAVHCSRTGVPSTPASAHSTCGAIADGQQCTKTTPRVDNTPRPFARALDIAHLRITRRRRLPQRPAAIGGADGLIVTHATSVAPVDWPRYVVRVPGTSAPTVRYGER